ncbi:hypothetical protein [Erythrobacter mangrovi]|uniref:Uncharacterized protein n=1 Tax=Erythrobacter mangrovi TaxID=2739433 RepID=A0A7D4CMJ9_9SPHN|nr:hypothetical protein [Erythrobacter mangrovi]QKG71388.1 hypothetical protein HQR01_08410 [Erythrobacter mangrovi]
MARKTIAEPAETNPERDFGVLLGWESHPAGERIMLIMQSSRKTPKTKNEVRDFRYYMTKEQAVLLGNYLFRLAGATAPRTTRPGLIERLFGR